MRKIKISESSLGVPIALFILEATIFLTAVFSVAQLELHSGVPGQNSLFLWVARAVVFGAAMMTCMMLFDLYRGRPGEKAAASVLRLVASLVLGGALLQVIYMLFPVFDLTGKGLVVASVVAFFLLGTLRPVFLDSVTSRRGHRRTVERRAAVNPATSGVTVLGRITGQFPKIPSLTGQNRITRRGL